MAKKDFQLPPSLLGAYYVNEESLISYVALRKRICILRPKELLFLPTYELNAYMNEKKND
jgi:hypothetical protein